MFGDIVCNGCEGGSPVFIIIPTHLHEFNNLLNHAMLVAEYQWTKGGSVTVLHTVHNV